MFSIKKLCTISILIFYQVHANSLAPLQKLTLPDTAQTRGFGYSVDSSADTNTIVVGSPADNNTYGAMWVFQKQDNTWKQEGGKITGQDTNGTKLNQGWTVSISSDGSRIATGGWGDSNNIGAAWVYERKLINGKPAWTQMGPKLVGSNVNGTESYQGTSVTLSGDGTKLAVGGAGDGEARGAVWIYEFNGTLWNEGPKISSTETDDSAEQGTSVALSDDGSILVVGAPGDENNKGAVLVYRCDGTICKQDGRKLVGLDAEGNARQGCSVALSKDGKTLAVGGYRDKTNTGAVWVYTYIGQWVQQGKKLVGSNSVDLPNQGYDVALSHDGNILLVGGYHDNLDTGATWKFIRTDGAHWQQDGEKIYNPHDNSAYQGYSLGISANGEFAVMGAPGDNYNNGAVWIYGPADSSSSRETYMTYWLPPLLAIAAGLITFGLKYIIKKHCCKTTDDSLASMHIQLNDPIALIESANDRRSSFA